MKDNPDGKKQRQDLNFSHLQSLPKMPSCPRGLYTLVEGVGVLREPTLSTPLLGAVSPSFSVRVSRSSPRDHRPRRDCQSVTSSLTVSQAPSLYPQVPTGSPAFPERLGNPGKRGDHSWQQASCPACGCHGNSASIHLLQAPLPGSASLPLLSRQIKDRS